MAAPGDRNTSSVPSQGDLHIPGSRRIGPYRLDALVASGPVSVVFKAWSASGQGSEEPTALYVPRMELQVDSNFQRLFLADCASARTVRHPSVSPLVASGQDLGLVWRASPWADGWDLDRMVRRADEHGRPADLALILALGVQLCQGLVALHERADSEGTPAPLMHGHIGLSRTLVRPDGRVLLLGVPSPRGRANTGYGLLHDLDASELAPEQLRQSGLGPRTDLYQLGLLLYTVWAGSSPFSRKTRPQTVSAVALGVGPLARVGELPASVRGIFESVLSVEPAGRPASARQLLAALESAASAVGRGEPGVVLRQRLAQLFPEGVGGPVAQGPLLAREEVRRLLVAIEELHEDRSPALVPIPELAEDDELDITMTVRIVPADEPTVSTSPPPVLPEALPEEAPSDVREHDWDSDEATDIFKAPLLEGPQVVEPRSFSEDPPEFITPGDLGDEAPTDEAAPARVRLGASEVAEEEEQAEPEAGPDEDLVAEVEGQDEVLPPPPPPVVRLPRATVDQAAPTRPQAAGGRAGVWLAVLGVGCALGLGLGLLLWPKSAPRPSTPAPEPVVAVAPPQAAPPPEPVAQVEPPAPEASAPEVAPPEAAPPEPPAPEPVAVAPSPVTAPPKPATPETAVAQPRAARSAPAVTARAAAPERSTTPAVASTTALTSAPAPQTAAPTSPAPSPAATVAAPELTETARPHLTDLQVSTSGDTVTLRGKLDQEGARPLGFLLEGAHGSQYVIRYKGVSATVASRDQSLDARLASAVHVQESGGDTTITVDLAPSVEVTPRLERSATGFQLTLTPAAIP